VTTKEQILEIGDALLRDKGFNAFSFSDISQALGIKNASIHYHFPSKMDLVCAIVEEHIKKVEALIERNSSKDPRANLMAFLSIYSQIKAENKICIVGSIGSDLNTVDFTVRETLFKLTSVILNWVTEFLEEGKRQDLFFYSIPSRTKALMIITNMLASVQLTRLTGDSDFKKIKETIVNDLTKK
jgi:AcrR family transcriptional regulator